MFREIIVGGKLGSNPRNLEKFKAVICLFLITKSLINLIVRTKMHYISSSQIIESEDMHTLAFFNFVNCLSRSQKKSWIISSLRSAFYINL